MKCVKSIKGTEVGTMKRVDDANAELRIKTGILAYAPKSEYKTWKNGNVEKTITKSREEVKVKKKH